MLSSTPLQAWSSAAVGCDASSWLMASQMVNASESGKGRRCVIVDPTSLLWLSGNEVDAL